MTDANKTGMNFERIAEPMRQAGERLKEAGARSAENSQAINMKVLEHAEKNAHEVFSALREAAQAKSISEVLEVQNRFIREQSNRGMEQIKEVGELIQRFGRDAIEPLTQRGGAADTGASDPAKE